jgi:hypothetical protein
MQYKDVQSTKMYVQRGVISLIPIPDSAAVSVLRKPQAHWPGTLLQRDILAADPSSLDRLLGHCKCGMMRPWNTLDV